MTENYIKVDIKSFQDICKKVETLEQRNEFLQNENDKQRRMINGLKINNSSLTLERNQLCDELNRIKAMSMFEFSNHYCSREQQEADGRAFAKALLGGK